MDGIDFDFDPVAPRPDLVPPPIAAGDDNTPLTARRLRDMLDAICTMDGGKHADCPLDVGGQWVPVKYVKMTPPGAPMVTLRFFGDTMDDAVCIRG